MSTIAVKRLDGTSANVKVVDSRPANADPDPTGVVVNQGGKLVELPFFQRWAVIDFRDETILATFNHRHHAVQLWEGNPKVRGVCLVVETKI